MTALLFHWADLSRNENRGFKKMARRSSGGWLRKNRSNAVGHRSTRRVHFESLESRMLLSAAPLIPELDVPAEPPGGAGRPEFLQGELLVGFRPGANDHDIRGIYHAHGLQELERLYHGELPGSVRRVSVPPQAAEAVQQALARNPHVEYAEPNFVATTSLVPNDTFYPYQWNFQNPHLGGIHVESAWEISTGSGVIVAV